MYKVSTADQLVRGQDAMRDVAALSAEEARYIVLRLVSEGRATLDELEELRRERRWQIEQLQAVVSRFSDHSPERGVRSRRKKETRPRNLTPEQRAFKRLQGRFVGMLRTIPAADRDEFRRIYREQSPEAAIEALERFRNGRSGNSVGAA